MHRNVFDRPGLGLVVQLAGLIALPQIVMQLMWTVDYWSAELGVVALVSLAVVVTEIATGLALSYKPRWVVATLAMYIAANIGLVACAIVVIGKDVSTATAIGAFVIDVVGLPTVIVAGALLSPPRGRSAGDLAAVMIVGGLAGAIAAPINTIAPVADLVSSHHRAGEWAAVSVRLAVAVLVSAFQLVAGIAMLRHGWPRARRALIIYIAMSLGVTVLLGGYGIVEQLMTDFPIRIVAGSVVSVLLAPMAPLVLWMYARTVPADNDDRMAGALATAGWMVAALAPIVGGRVLLLVQARHAVDDGMPFGVALLCGCQAITNLLAGFSALRASVVTHIYATASLIVAIVLAISGSILLFRSDRAAVSVWPVVVVAAASGVLTWVAANSRQGT